MNNLHRAKSVFISDGTGLPSNNAAITAVSTGDIGVFGTDMTALNPAGGDTITTQPAIYIVEGRVDASGVSQIKRSSKIAGTNVLSYKGKSYSPSVRCAWTIGYNRKTAAGTIEATSSTNYKFRINFLNDKWLYSNRPEALSINFDSSASATQLSIATQAAAAINNAAGWKNLITAIVVGDGTGVYGVTGASNYGVEITANEVDQFYATTYTKNQVYFKVFVDDSFGFGTTTTCTQINNMDYGNGTYTEVYEMENLALGNEGVTNRRLWPIPVQTYAASSAYMLSSAIAETVTGTSGEDKVTFSADVSAKIRVGENVELGGVNYKIKYFISTTVAVLTSVLTGALAGDAVKVRFKYDMVTIEFNDTINTPTGVVAVANKSVVICVPSIDAGGAYNSTGTAATNLKAILDGWMTTTPGAFANISI